MQKLKIIKFWCIAFFYILWNVIKGYQWNMVYVDFHIDEGEVRPIRKQLIAKRTVDGLNIYWQDLNVDSGSVCKEFQTKN